MHALRQLIGREPIVDFARRAGIGRATIYRLLDGAPATKRTIDRIARAAAVPPELVARIVGARS